jgi:hypothetical protein
VNKDVVARWPRVRATKDGGIRVSGRAAQRWRIRALRSAVLFLIFILGCAALAMSIVPVFLQYPETRDIAAPLAEARYWLAVRSHEAWPAGQSWLDLGGQRVSYALLIAGGAAWLFSRPFSYLISFSAGFLFPVLVKRRFKIRFDAETVRVSGLLWNKRYPLEPGVPVQFMCEALPPEMGEQQPLTKVSMRFGYREVVLCRGINQKDGDRMSAAFNYALAECGGTGGFPGVAPALSGVV